MRVENTSLVKCFVFIFILIYLSIDSEAHSAIPNGSVHQHITKESEKVWKLIPPEMISYFSKDINSPLENVQQIPFTEYEVDIRIVTNPWCYDGGDDIITGSAEEDICGGSGGPITQFRSHYWDADTPNEGKYSKTIVDSEFDLYYLLLAIDPSLYVPAKLSNSPSNYEHARYIWEEKVIPNYLNGNINESYYYLGRVIHLLQDATVPAHMLLDTHINGTSAGDDSFEAFVANEKGSFSDTQNRYNFYHWNGSNYTGQQYMYENISSIFSKEEWSEINPRISEASYPEYFFKLFWYTAQKTQYFASDDVNGNDYYRKSDDSAEYTFSPSLWAGENVNIVNDSSKIEEDQENCGVGDCPALVNISNALMPHSMKATAGLYELFYDTANSYHWPTFHHDNRRTGFTILKGDLSSASKKTYGFALSGGITSTALARPSIANVNNNDNEDQNVIISFSKAGVTDGFISNVEYSKKWWQPGKKWTEVWNTNIGYSVTAPPSLGNTYGDKELEIVAGLKNGSLIVLNSDGAIKWQYSAPKKYSALYGGSFRGNLGFTAISDIDNDGKAEIIFTDSSKTLISL